MRNPVIKITYIELLNLLLSLDSLNSIDINNIALNILKYSANNKQDYKLDSYSINKDKLIEQIHLVLTTIRLEHGHKFNHNIKEGTSQYTVLINVCNQIIAFSEAYSLSIIEAAKVYFNIGIKLMKDQYRLQNFIYYSEQIESEFLKANSIKSDSNKEITKELIKQYKEIYPNIKNIEKDYMYDFVEASKLIVEFESTPKEWLSAQLKYLSTIMNVVLPKYFHGVKSKERYYQNKSENNNIFESESILPKWYKNKLNGDNKIK